MIIAQFFALVNRLLWDKFGKYCNWYEIKPLSFRSARGIFLFICQL